jgi:hypothetical protein
VFVSTKDEGRERKRLSKKRMREEKKKKKERHREEKTNRQHATICQSSRNEIDIFKKTTSNSLN